MTGPFHYIGTNGWEAWGMQFPSDHVILEWISDSGPGDAERCEGPHHSRYVSYEDFRRVCKGDVTWGSTP